MAVVSGRRSTLNPDAPLFIPQAFRQVEDFSPEWWELVKTSTWFRDYWVHENQEQENFEGNEDVEDDIANLLPESFDLGIDEEFQNQFEFTTEPAKNEESKEKPRSGLEIEAETLIKNLSLKSPKGGVKSPVEGAKYREKAVQCVSPKFSPRRIIQQPR
ncbi:protein EARLY RESPONSIVE TO DEHYDRATION 15-like isoform X2 [Tasmannia lanceolata]|uniref:protein EARLY RESPONSIVE TO DEHYDRATION 15-like isoform X2 n=1 Tax=Tasmannia lanceolata TaxID=3420 RepID=UPI004063E14E